MKKYRHAVGYLRISSDSQKDNTSIENQKDSIKYFCMQRGIYIEKFFVETYTGTKLNRPQFDKAIKYLKENKGNIDLFLTKKADRFTRGQRVGLTAFDEIKNLGVEVNFVDEWIEDINSPQGQMLMQLKFSFAEYERAVIYERTRAEEIKALLSGRYTKTPPLGYSRGVLPIGNIHAGKKGIFPNDKAPLVKELFEDYATNLYTQEALVKKYKLKGLKLSKSSVSVILDNILYTGIIDLKKHKIAPYNQIEGCHEPIISAELFNKVQMLKNGRNRAIKEIRTQNPDFPLNRFLYCSCCGSPMRGSTGNNGSKKKVTRYYSYYRCANNCGEKYKPEEIHPIFLNALQMAKPSEEVVELFRMMLIDDYEKNMSEHTTLLSAIESKIKTLKDEQQNASRLVVRGTLTESAYLDLVEVHNRELMELESEKDKYGEFQKDLDKYVSFGLTLLTNIDVFYKNAPIGVKTKLIGSYFNDKLYFEKNKFRTLPFNDTIALLCRYNKGFKGLENKKGGDFKNTSCLVAKTGIEPVTSGL
ncbi:recombinase family protein [Riemerella anatipestifer]|uniref:recombinase family protein n=1 Tax=Riemerella anatipestifer TaxID=34085 RepID=UPI0033993C78